MAGFVNFIGITIGENASYDSGICILNENKEIIRIDKAYSIDELSDCINRVSGLKNSIICIDMPEYFEMLEGKWRIINKGILPLKLDFFYEGKNNWTSRYSDRGADFYRKLLEKQLRVYRYSSNHVKTSLGLHPYIKERTPAGCKFLQNMIKEKLKIKNFPPNMLPISVLDAILGAYLAMNIAVGVENKDYKSCFKYKDMDIIGFC